MQLKEYNSLGMHQKVVMLGDRSVFLASHLDEDTSSSLYAHGNFYIEVVWDSVTNNLIEIIAFKNNDRLDKYLGRVLLTGLL